MKTLLLFSVIIICFCQSAMSMSYVPIPFEKQLEESYGVVEGRYISKNYKKNKNNEVITVNVFFVENFIGFKKNEILSQKYFQLITPGGVWQDQVYQVHGIPHFSKDEKVILLIKRGVQGFHLSHLGLSKYKIHRVDGRRVISSIIFPNHPRLGQIDYSDYRELVINNFQQRFIGFSKGKKIYLEDRLHKKFGRMPASIKKKQNKKVISNSINIHWLVLVLAVLGLGSTIYFRKIN